MSGVRLSWAAAAVVTVACSRAPQSKPTEARDARSRDEVPMSTDPQAAPVSASVLTTQARKPPLVELHLDLIARNPAASARWLLIPTTVDRVIGARGVGSLQVERWRGAAGTTDVGKFQGTGGFYAVQLAPGASLRLRGLPVGWWRGDDEQAPRALGVVLADTVTIGGKPAEVRFPDGAPLVRDARDADRHEPVHSSSFHPDLGEDPVVLGGAQRIELALTLP